MKKSILNLGKALNKAEQKNINGGIQGGGHCCSWRGEECVYWEEWGTTCPFLN